jgi:hypothetical protein
VGSRVRSSIFLGTMRRPPGRWIVGTLLGFRVLHARRIPLSLHCHRAAPCPHRNLGTIIGRLSLDIVFLLCLFRTRRNNFRFNGLPWSIVRNSRPDDSGLHGVTVPRGNWHGSKRGSAGNGPLCMDSFHSDFFRKHFRDSYHFWCTVE